MSVKTSQFFLVERRIRGGDFPEILSVGGDNLSRMFPEVKFYQFNNCPTLRLGKLSEMT